MFTQFRHSSPLNTKWNSTERLYKKPSDTRINTVQLFRRFNASMQLRGNPNPNPQNSVRWLASKN